MRKLYYTICIDTIIQYRKNPQNEGMWKFYTMLYLSLCMGMNLSMLVLFFEVVIFKRKYNYDIPIDIFPGERIDFMFRFFVMYMLLPLLLNYFLIFYKDRYKQLEEKYIFHNGKYFFWYLIISLMTPMVVFITYYLFQD